jgi:hypothetical protein
MMRMKKLLAAIILFLLPAYALATSITMPTETWAGASYPITATADNVQFRTPCALTAYDYYGQAAHSWTSDAQGFPLSTDRNGSIASYVIIPNDFVTDSNYTMSLVCGSTHFQPQNVTITVAGTSGLNIAFLNQLNFANKRPDDFWMTIFIAIGVLIVAGFAYQIVFRKKHLFG